jgi:hypothetical protein
MTMIPVAKAQVEWADNKKGRVTEVLVFDRSDPPHEESRYDLLDNSGGACSADWVTGEDPRSSPEGIFIEMLHVGFVSPDAMLQALEEFGKIETCEWARTMAAALQLRLRVDRR